jgi:nucleoside-diphosphate-sugar epimerase
MDNTVHLDPAGTKVYAVHVEGVHSTPLQRASSVLAGIRQQERTMKIFVTGATGYIGGSVAERLIALGHEVTGLVRTAEKASLLQERGIEPILGSLDDVDVLSKAARESDGVIHTASADHEGVVEVLVAALARSGKFLIHTSGSGIANDRADGEYAATVRITEDTYFEAVPYRQGRIRMNRYVREAGIDQGIRTIVICPAMIYGRGQGLHKESEQIPQIIAFSKQVGAGVYFGKGLNRYSNVHIDDLVNLYLLTIEKAPSGSFFFAENGDASFQEIAELIGKTQGLGGKTVSIGIDVLIAQSGDLGRYGVAANSFVSATNARRLGWKPVGESLESFFEGYVPGE